MLYKPLFWILLSFLLVIPFAIADFPYSQPLGRTGNETFDSNAAMSANWSKSFTSNGKLSLNGDRTSTNDRITYVHSLSNPTIQPWSVRFDLNIRNSTPGRLIFDTNYNNISGMGQLLSIELRENSNGFILRNPETGASAACDGLLADNTKHSITVKAGTDGTMNLSINNTQKCSLAWKTPSPPNYYYPQFWVWIGTQTFTSCGFEVDNWVAVNQTEYPSDYQPQPDTIPPFWIIGLVILFMMILYFIMQFKKR